MKKHKMIMLGIVLLLAFSIGLGGCQKEAANYGETAQEENSADNCASNILKFMYQPNQNRYEEYLINLDHECNPTQCDIDFSKHDVNNLYLGELEKMCTENCLDIFEYDKHPVFMDYFTSMAEADVILTNIQLVDASAADGEEIYDAETKKSFYYTITMSTDGDEFTVQGQIKLRKTDGQWKVFFMDLSDKEALSQYITGENIYAVPAEPSYQEIKIAGMDVPITEAFFAESEKVVTPIKLTEMSKVDNGVSFAEEWVEKYQWELLINGQRSFYDETYIYSASDDGTVTISDKETNEVQYVISEFEDQWTWYCNFAKIRDDILYIGKIRNGYAAPNSSYLMAYDLKEEKLLWRSEDQTYNSGSFVMIGDVIICGYGFTDEPDYLYQIDANTGKVIDKTKIAKMADFILENDGKLYVHTYSYDYVFELEGIEENF